MNTNVLESEDKRESIFPILKKQGIHTYLVFAGQGADPLPLLRSFYENSQSERELLLTLAEILEEEFVHLTEDRQSGFFPFGFSLSEWLEYPEKSPRDSDIRSISTYTVPLILIAQIISLSRLAKFPKDWRLFRENIQGLYGHSQGVYAAYIVSASPSLDEFTKNAKSTLRALFHLALRSAEEFPELDLGAKYRKLLQTEEKGSPMAHLLSKDSDQLNQKIEQFNSTRSAEDMVFIGLKNGPKANVLCGSPESLLEFRESLRSAQFENLDSWSFLPVSVPFHSLHLSRVPILVQKDFERSGFFPKAEELEIPIYDTKDGEDLRFQSDLPVLFARMMVSDPLDWEKTISSIKPDRILLLSFGPGNSAERLCVPYLEGRSFLIRNLSTAESLHAFQKERDFYFSRDWASFAPKTVELPNGLKVIDNVYTRWTGRPPVFGGGMTPSTVEPEIVVEAAKSGYIVEWAGGGQVTEELFHSRLNRIKESLPANKKIIFNILYLDAYLWNLQMPLIKKAKLEGAPIEGVTISAGIPDLEEAVNIIQELNSVGIWLNSFKPGTIDQIHQVISIAKKIPDTTFMMQIEGGAAGGHHSWEDLLQLVESTYSEIRKCANIVLAVGGGISEPEDAKKWLFGNWNPNSRMPVDAVFLGTRLMACKECATSDKVKQALVELQGAEEWKNGKDGKNLGGVVSGKSGLGADIYYAENSWTKLSSWAEALTKGKDVEAARSAVSKNKKELIQLINQTAKPYFGDLQEMSYTEVLERFVDLVCPGQRLVSPEGEWPDHPFIDKSFRTRLVDLIARFEARIADQTLEGTDSILTKFESLDEPENFLVSWKDLYPQANQMQILPEDRLYFLDVCKRPGKPVNFIPVLDEDLVKWVRSDSLWYSHCKGMDPDSCAWIPGPRAIRGIRKANESVFEVLNGFAEALYTSKNEKIDWSEWFLSQRNRYEFPMDSVVLKDQGGLSPELSILDPSGIDSKEWIHFLSSLGKGFVSALLQSNQISGNQNDLAIVFRPEKEDRFEWQKDENGNLESILLHRKDEKKAELRSTSSDSAILEMIFKHPDGKEISTKRTFFAGSELGQLILEDPEFKTRSIQSFYKQTWGVAPMAGANDSGAKDSHVVETEVVLDKKSILEFKAVSGELKRSDLSGENSPNASLSMCVVFGWKSLVKPLFDLHGFDLFQLLHFSQKFQWEKPASSLQAGDKVNSRAELRQIQIGVSGTRLKVVGNIAKDQTQVASFETDFFIRGKQPVLESFDLTEYKERIRIGRMEEASAFDSLPWVQKTDSEIAAQVDDRFEFRWRRDLSSGTVDGRIIQIRNHIQTDWGKFGPGIPEIYLERLFTQLQKENAEIPLDRPYLASSEIVFAPKDMTSYAKVSGDTNPIHLDGMFARLGGWQEKIVHGLWTSARVVKHITEYLCEGDPSRLRSLEENFENPVFLGEELRLDMNHIGQKNGDLIYEIQITNRNGERKLFARAEVSPSYTSYVFTGQGSQSQGMGMKLMEEFPEARQIWERAERTTSGELGFSILEIVKENPTSIKVDHQVWNHPKGVINLTQFTQVGLVTKSIADWEILRKRGFLVPEAPFAGHSLGEFSALSARGFLSLENVIRIVYGRGLTMQNLVPRDSEGKSPYGMSVVLGNRHVGLTEDKILSVVDSIRQKSGLPLEVVNYNIRDKQYSVTGDLHALEEMEAAFKEIVRGKKTTIRLEGIDVPFHSRVLVNGVDAFRKTLEANIPKVSHFEDLDGKYIPNLVALPFSLEIEFIETVFKTSGSPVLKDLLQAGLDSLEKNHLRRTLLIELLAYQFAMPVQWIRTQELLFENLGIRRLIDLGARGDLAGMARQTIRDKADSSSFQILQIEENRNQVLYELEDAERMEWTELPSMQEGELEESVPREDAPTARETSSSSQQNAEMIEPEPVLHSGGDEESVILERKDSLYALLATKAGVRTDEISPDESIDDLLGGNSSKRNQVMADLGTEFKTTNLDGGHEKPIREVVKLLEEQSSYNQPGPYLRTAFEEMVKKYFPPDFARQQIFKHLKEERGLTESGVFALTVYLPLVARGGESIRKGNLSTIPLESRLADPKAASNWIDKAVDQFAFAKGIQIGKASQRKQGGNGHTVDSKALEELEKKYFGLEGLFGKTIKNFQETLLGEDPFREFKVKDLQTLESARMQSNVYLQIEPLFDRDKIVNLGNPIQWAKKKMLKLRSELWVFGRNAIYESDSHYLRNQDKQEVSRILEYILSNLRLELEEEKSTAEIQRISKLMESFQKLTTEIRDYPVHKFCESILKPEFEITKSGEWKYAEIENKMRLSDWLQSKVQILSTKNFGSSFETDRHLSSEFLESIRQGETEGLSFAGKTILVTGASLQSIALETVKGFLAGGAEVILTTSSYSYPKIQKYKQIYQDFGSKGSSLKILPFSQGSFEDIDALVSWLKENDLEIDFLLPFGAIPEENFASDLDVSSLRSLQVMLLGVEKLLAVLGKEKLRKGESPLRVLLPLSPNHGVFGRDGMYAETKLGLETLFRKKFSEQKDWGANTILIGCIIGWVRGTGLMEANDLVAQELEQKTNAKTFSTREMGSLILSAAHWSLEHSEVGASKVDLTGGLGDVQNLGSILAGIRASIQTETRFRREVTKILSQISQDDRPIRKIHPLPKAVYGYPELPGSELGKQFTGKTKLDLSKEICVVGFAEIGPAGNSVSRWELEKNGILSLEAAVELAWMMGLITYQAVEGGRSWTDSETGEAISEWEVKKKYEDKILAHTGIRKISQDCLGFDPDSLFAYVDVVLEQDFVMPVSSAEEAKEFHKAESDSTEIYHDPGEDKWFIRRKKGSVVKVRKAMGSARKVGGQIPTGWSPERVGIPKEIIKQVDKITLYNLYCTCEAFLRAGLDPMELYSFLHPGKVGSTVGSGLGGMTMMKRMFQDFVLGNERQHDALQESLINVTAAWAITSYVGAYGPVQTPVAACATAGVSLEMAMSLIKEGKADFMVAGAFDDFSQEGLIGFGDMQATASSEEMEKKGILPSAMCRPNDSRRGGFVESQGGGIMLLARGDLAKEAGLPVYGILGYAASRTDGIQTSIPAPGLGLLGLGAQSDTQKSPLAEVMDTYGIDANDIGLVYKHDTSTKANDKNENRLLYTLLSSLGRDNGNLLPVVSQKSLTGHSKGGAALWQAIGLLQTMNDGVVTGNRNLDDVDLEMNPYSFMTFTDESILMGKHRIKAGILTSLGFGHVGVLALFIHPDFFISSLTPEERKEYEYKRRKREIRGRDRYQSMRLGIGEPLYKRRTESYFEEIEESDLLLNAGYRKNQVGKWVQ